MEVFRPFGTAATILFPLIDAGANDFEATPVTFASGDTQISKDEGAFANTGSNPSHEGRGIYSLALTATEMEAERIVVTVIDSATKEWEDQAIVIRTKPEGAIRAQKAQAGAAGTITLDSGASATDDTYNGAIVKIVSGTGAGQSRIIDDYTGTSKVASVAADWATNPDNTSIFELWPFGAVPANSTNGVVEANMTQVSGDATAADNLEAMLDGTGGVTLSASVSGSIGSLATQAKADVNAEVDSALDTAIPGSPTANSVNERIKALDELLESGGSGDAAAIKAETDKLDSAHSEPTGVPAANESPLDKLAYLFMGLRNQVTVTATKKTFFDDGGSAEFAKTLSDDGTTYTETESGAP